MELYLLKGNKPVGPYSEEQLQDMMVNGTVLATDLVWHKEISEWVELKSILTPTVQPTAPHPYSKKETIRAIWIMISISLFCLFGYYLDAPNERRVSELRQKLAEEEKLEGRFKSMAKLSIMLEPHGMKPSDTDSMLNSAAKSQIRSDSIRAELNSELSTMRWLWGTGIILSGILAVLGVVNLVKHEIISSS